MGRLFSTSDDQTTVMWDISNPDVKEWTKRRILKGHRDGNMGIVLSPDGTMLATVGADKAARVWDITDSDPKNWKLRELRNFTGHERMLRTVQWSDESKTLVTCSDDRTARVYDVSAKDPQEWGLLAVLEGVHTSTIPGVDISTGSMYIATGSADGYIGIWAAGEDRGSWKLIGKPGCRPEEEDVDPDPNCHGHIAAVRGVSFWGSPGGKRFLLASVSDDGTLKVWDMKTLGTEPLIPSADAPSKDAPKDNKDALDERVPSHDAPSDDAPSKEWKQEL